MDTQPKKVRTYAAIHDILIDQPAVEWPRSRQMMQSQVFAGT